MLLDGKRDRYRENEDIFSTKEWILDKMQNIPRTPHVEPQNNLTWLNIVLKKY